MKNETRKGLTDKAAEIMMDALNKVNTYDSPIQNREKILVASDLLEIIKGLDGIKTDEEREMEQMMAEDLRGMLERGKAARQESKAIYESIMKQLRNGRETSGTDYEKAANAINNRCD